MEPGGGYKLEGVWLRVGCWLGRLEPEIWTPAPNGEELLIHFIQLILNARYSCLASKQMAGNGFGQCTASESTFMGNQRCRFKLLWLKGAYSLGLLLLGQVP